MSSQLADEVRSLARALEDQAETLRRRPDMNDYHDGRIDGYIMAARMMFGDGPEQLPGRLTRMAGRSSANRYGSGQARSLRLAAVEVAALEAREV